MRVVAEGEKEIVKVLAKELDAGPFDVVLAREVADDLIVRLSEPRGQADAKKCLALAAEFARFVEHR